MNQTTDNPFSTVKFFKLFEAELKKVHTYPLSLENLTVQQDAFARLADTEAEPNDLENPDIFAVLECSRKEKDSDLRFNLQFAGGCFNLEVEGLFNAYYDLRDKAVFRSESEAAKQLIHVLRLLSNGQLAVSITHHADSICATELLLTDRQTANCTVIATIPNFRRRDKRASAEELDHVVLKNHYQIDTASVQTKSFMYDLTPKKEIKSYGRPGKTAQSQPLTFEEWLPQAESMVQENIGQKPGESNLWYLLKSWEFWVIGLLLGIVPLSLRQAGHLPSFVEQNPSLIGLILTPLDAYLTVLVKEKRLARKNNART